MARQQLIDPEYQQQESGKANEGHSDGEGHGHYCPACQEGYYCTDGDCRLPKRLYDGCAEDAGSEIA